MNDCGQSVDVKIIERCANPSRCCLRRQSLTPIGLCETEAEVDPIVLLQLDSRHEFNCVLSQCQSWLNGFIFPPPRVTRLDPGRLTRRPALLPFRRVLQSPRTLGVCVTRGARAGKDVSARADSDRCCFPSFSARQLRRNHFVAAICVAPSGRLPRSLCRSRGRPASSDNPPVARRPRNAVTLPPAAPSASANRQHRVIFLELRIVCGNQSAHHMMRPGFRGT